MKRDTPRTEHAITPRTERETRLVHDGSEVLRVLVLWALGPRASTLGLVLGVRVSLLVLDLLEGAGTRLSTANAVTTRCAQAVQSRQPS